MKEIKVKCISNNMDEKSIEQISDLLNDFKKHKLENNPWPQFPFDAIVSFTIAYDAKNIFLKYYVEEKYLRAENKITNSPVYEDSCVEFFISFDEGANYYNIEFNCIGTGLIGYGSSKENRRLLDESLVENLKKKSLIISENKNSAKWDLTLAIPLSTFIYSTPLNLQDVSCKSNFYKCGDLLPEPHFITWSPIEADEPNFHLPQFFGNLVFG